MRIRLRHFWTPKLGSNVSEYEDAFWPRRLGVVECSSSRLAVADGATETSFAALWANRLVRMYGKRDITDGQLWVALPTARYLWKERVSGKTLPWYAEEKLRLGAFASLLGLTLMPSSSTSPDGKWRALSVGDCCLIHLRGERILGSFPFNDSKQFTSRPILLSSIPRTEDYHDSVIDHAVGHWNVGDEFLLMTDAIACWFFRRIEADHDPCQPLLALRSQSDFARFVDIERADRDRDGTRVLKNDDVTLLRCEILSA